MKIIAKVILLFKSGMFYYQFGFREREVLLLWRFRIADSVDGGDTSIGVFLDLSKAFDTVNHDILFDKLSYYGINNETKN